MKCQIQLHFNIFIYSPHVNLLNICDKLSLPEEIIRAFHEVGALTRGTVFPHEPTPPLLIATGSIKFQVKAGPTAWHTKSNHKQK